MINGIKLSKAQRKALETIFSRPGSVIHGGTRKSLVSMGLIEAHSEMYQRLFSRTKVFSYYCRITEAGRAWLEAN